jgi:hypothetical protein
MSYVGVPPFGQTVRTITEVTATAGQTAFTPSGGYLPGYVDVSLNGIALSSADFTATNGTTVTLAAAAAVGDEFRCVAYWPVSLMDTYRKTETDTLLAAKQAADAELSTLAGMSSSRATFLASNEGFGFRNRIINGDMRIDQRNAGASVAAGAGSTYSTVDRWRTERSGGGAFTIQQVTTAPTGFQNSALVTVTTVDSSIAAGDFYDIQQFIEGFNVADLGWGTASAQAVTLSFWVRSSVTGTFAGGLGNGAADRSYVFTYAISAANTWEYKTVTIPGDTSGTWVTNNGRGMVLTYDFGNGSSYQAAAGSWVGQYAVATSGSVKLISTLSATWQVTGVQLEAGSVASPFERRDYGRELMLCCRYFENVIWIVNGYWAQWTGVEFYGAQYPFLVEKRASPSISNFTSGGYWVAAGQSAFSAQTTHNFTISYVNTKGFSARSNRPVGNSGPTVGGMYMWESSVTIPVSAEL